VLDLEYPKKKCSGDFPLIKWQTILRKVITALTILTSLISQKSKKLAACSSVRLKEVLV
jgi:hypothetical protein